MTVLATPGTTAAAAGQRGYHLGWWGMVVLIATEATIFLGLLSSYFFLQASSKTWPQGGIEPPKLLEISIFTALLLGSTIPVVWAEKAIERGRVGHMRVALLIAWLMGAAFFAHQIWEFAHLDFGISDNAYASIFLVTTGLHGLHVLAGLMISAVVQLKAGLGEFDADRHLTVDVFALYWHFVDVVWVFVFTSLYLSPHWR
jgi:heme/copper-type cytochrome/quinol oxidase subunit 3